ncbi:MAG: energy transducer TonB [Bacteroidetes bacterium]|nr:energy transducer TonB [Bacteroidota bacterium]
MSPKGKILYPYVAHGLGKEYDADAIKLVRSMPAWKPGKEKGKAVYVRSSLPVRF